ncbi:MAG: Maf family nucleotide pyrophosphatase [Betaproteobacteria bacterium]
MKKKLVLASSSRYRAELLSRLQIVFETVKPDLDEVALPAETPASTALRLSIAKARYVAAARPGALVIGSDQVADFSGLHVGKPGTIEAARQQLRSMRGRELVFHSGLALVNADTGETQSRVVATLVRYRELTDIEIEHYLQRESALDCAGSAKSEGLGIALIASMQSDDPTALIGLPLIALGEMLRNEGLHILD